MPNTNTGLKNQTENPQVDLDLIYVRGKTQIVKIKDQDDYRGWWDDLENLSKKNFPANVELLIVHNPRTINDKDVLQEISEYAIKSPTIKHYLILSEALQEMQNNPNIKIDFYKGSEATKDKPEAVNGAPRKP